MRILKQLPALLLAAALLAALPGVARAAETEAYAAPQAIAAQSGVVGSTLTWALDEDGTLTVSGNGEMTFKGGRPWSGLESQIRRVIIEDGVTTVGSWAFYECANLTEVQLADSVTEIGMRAFSSCERLQSLRLPKGLITIGDWALADSDLREIHLSTGVTTIGTSAFSGNHNLTAFSVDDANRAFAAKDGILYNKSMATLIRCPERKAGTVSVASGVTEIGRGAFMYCSDLDTITLPNSLRTVGAQAFWQCTGLKELTLPSGVTRLEYGTFEDCWKLEKLVIPSSVTTLEDGAIEDCGDGLVIYGAAGSAAEQYAKQNEIAFQTLAEKLDAPAVTAAQASADGVRINWSKVNGAAQYRVFRKTETGNWQRLGDTAETSYVDRTAKPAVKYIYTVRCLSADGTTYTSDADGKGKSVIYYLSTPALPTLKTAGNGIVIQWSRVSGAEKYRIFRRTGSGNWERLGDAAGTNWIDRTAEKGKTYSYTICCLSKDGKTLTSDYDQAGKTILFYIGTPSITKLQSAANGIVINWDRVSGAEKYRIFRRTGNGKWERLGDASGTAWVDRTAKKGTTYSYTIRCVSKDGKTYTSGYDKTGKSILYYVATPAITKLQSAANGIVINWSKVDGAQKYRIWRKTENGSWERLGDASGTAWVDRTAKRGVTYTYTVRCIASDGKTYISGFDSVGKTVKR